ncbi:UNVERIFIED_ORG: hypothetical protein ABIC54_006425 [Burkholderia sp. 1263]
MPQNEKFPLPARLAAATAAAGRVSVTFRDRAFRSRTIVFEDGSTLAVGKSAVATTDHAQIAALERHPDFERVSTGS